MNTQHTLHQIKLQQWASVFQEQAASGMTAKAWCKDNNLSIHAYNYWKRLLKEDYLKSAMNEQQEIVSVDMSLATSVCSTNATTLPSACESRELYELHESRNTHTPITITIGDISIQAGSNISDEYLIRILKAVRHA